ncbi:MAG: GNAT family N-acetyltransferase [Clostridiales bacterium]|nr:GNAT family N-acetyltransferase [Clostridiales bacterium]
MKHCGTQTIITERLLLRRFTQDDAVRMFVNWASDDEVTKFMTWQAHSDISVTKSVLNSWIELYARDDFYNWAIVLKDGNPIGSIGCNPNIGAMNDCAMSVGYCISKKYWHQGFTSEALKAVISYIFDYTDCMRLEATHDPRNPNSGKVMQKCGMRYEGTLRKRGKNNLGICDQHIYSILRDEK